MAEEDQNSLKREREADDATSGPASKKAHIADSDDTVQVKILIPSAAVGAIIGKGGETMRNLKNESKCRVQMSKNQEVYQGTNERICMVKGKIVSVMMVVEAIQDKIREKVDGSTHDPFDFKDTNRTHEVKLLMPNTSAGMVIGKSGANIKDIREICGCQIQVFPKAGSAEAKNSLERVITVAHDELSKLLEAVQRVLEKVAADPMHAQAVNQQDHDNFGQVFGATGGFGYPTGYNPRTGNYSNGPGKFNPMQGLGNNELMSFLDSLQMTLRTSGFNEPAVAEVMQAMQVLAKYNIMGLGLGLGVAAMAQMRSGESSTGYSNTGGYQGMNSSFSSQNDTSSTQQQGQCWGYSASQMGNQAQTGQQREPGASFEAGGYAQMVIVERPCVQEGTIDLEVPDAIVGAVLGPKAKTLNEIQTFSGCRVQVHKKGEEHSLPEGSRLISLTGGPESIKHARTIIERVINEEQNRRESGGAPHPRGGY